MTGEASWFDELVKWCNGNQGFIALIALVVAFIAFIVPAIIALMTLRQVGRNHYESTRPVLTAKLRLDIINDAILLSVKNHGASPASNVRVIFDENFASGEPHAHNIPAMLKKKYSNAVSVWGPGEEYIDHFQMYSQYRTEGEALPPPQSPVKISYEYLGKKFSESFTLDFEAAENEAENTYHTPSAQEKIALEVTKLASKVDVIGKEMEQARRVMQADSPSHTEYRAKMVKKLQGRGFSGKERSSTTKTDAPSSKVCGVLRQKIMKLFKKWASR